MELLDLNGVVDLGRLRVVLSQGLGPEYSNDREVASCPEVTWHG